MVRLPPSSSWPGIAVRRRRRLRSPMPGHPRPVCGRAEDVDARAQGPGMTENVKSARSARAAIARLARHHCCRAPVQPRHCLPQMACLPEYPLKAPDRPSPYAHPARLILDSVAGADRRSRHRPLRLCAGAAGHARFARLVVFRGRLHEHDQRGRLSRRRLAGLADDQAFRAGRDRCAGERWPACCRWRCAPCRAISSC